MIVHVDGGCFPIPGTPYRFTNAYFSVVNDEGGLLHFKKNIGDFHNFIAEYRAIEWAVFNIKERPLTVTSDCTVAISWAKKGGWSKKFGKIKALPLKGVTVEYQHANLADQWNAVFHSPKKMGDLEFYTKWKKEKAELQITK